MQTRKVCASMAVIAACSFSASAADAPRGVIELFTSQGCSSCPPADKVLADLAKSPDMIALTFPVDYWDYIGWMDTLADPSFTARQKAYAASRGDGQVYTPQAVIDGVSHCVGSDRADIDKAVLTDARKDGTLTVPVSMALENGKVSVDIKPSADPAVKSGSVLLLETAFSRTVQIHRGENSGRSLTYTNVVRKITRLGAWDGRSAHFERAAPNPAEGYVVLVQADAGAGPGAILGAAQTR